MKKNLIYFISISLLFVSYNTVTTASELPDLGERSATIISAKETKRLGKKYMLEIRRMMTLIEDPIINDYISTIGKKLVAQTKNSKRNFHFFIVNDATCNAFAGPGANIGINSGAILTTTTVSELAAIMAHEIAHVTQYHIEQLMQTIKYSNIAATIGMIAAIFITTDITAATLGGITQNLINFTREQETAADYIGMKLLTRAGFDSRAMPRIFERMNKQDNYTKNIPQQLLTHPKFSIRIAEAQSRALATADTLQLEEKFNLMRIRTLILTTQNLPKVIKNLHDELKQHKNSAPLRYGYALALYKNSQIIPALNIARKLQTEYPHEVLFQMLLAQLTAKNSPTQATNILANAMAKHKNYYPLILQYAQNLLVTNQPLAARNLLRAICISRFEDPNIYLLLAQAYAANKQPAEAYQTKADAYALHDHYRKAILLLQQALKIPKLSTNNRAIINAKIKQYKTAEKDI